MILHGAAIDEIGARHRRCDATAIAVQGYPKQGEAWGAKRGPVGAIGG